MRFTLSTDSELQVAQVFGHVNQSSRNPFWIRQGAYGSGRKFRNQWRGLGLVQRRTERRNEMSSALSSSSVAWMVFERVDISLLICSIFFLIIWLFWSASRLSAAILAASSSCSNW
ncbi:hypothetical protein DPEC_G00292530 [Dallia pectoralis]|uniref:Uncharacterized protein n=1 Tax=Dallia pectoralis TaxID=75939 RepID=A0ACC2FHZ6_DALPE|nr:hypothetical protein DPEC_G00292530 [Dallia pectoralis]